MRQLVTDRGTDFSSLVGEVLWKRLGVKHSLTAAMYPQCNALAEVYNKNIDKYMRAMLEDLTLDWPQYLPTLRIAYNSSVHKTMRTSPFWLTFFHSPNLPYFNLQQQQTFTSSDWGTNSYIRLKKIYGMVRENASQAEGKRLRYSDTSAVHRTFALGEQVLVHFPRGSHPGNKKFVCTWRDGYRIKEILGDYTYRLTSAEKGKRDTTVHVDRIKKRPDQAVEEEGGDSETDSGHASGADADLPATTFPRPQRPTSTASSARSATLHKTGT